MIAPMSIAVSAIRPRVRFNCRRSGAAVSAQQEIRLLAKSLSAIAPRLCRFASEKLRFWCFGSRELAIRLYRARPLPTGQERRAIAAARSTYAVDRPAWWLG